MPFHLTRNRTFAVAATAAAIAGVGAVGVSAVGAPAAHAGDATCANATAQLRGLSTDQIESAVLCLANNERLSQGLPPLHRNSVLATAARNHSQDMVARDYFSHDSPEGTGPDQRFSDLGYRFSSFGENIWGGFDTPAAAVNWWMSSPGHRANILSPGFTEIGIGAAQTADGMSKLTQTFGTPTGAIEGGPTGLEPEFQAQDPAPAPVPAPQPAPQPAPKPGPTAPTTTTARAKLSTTAVRMTRRGMRLTVSCATGRRCTGTTTIRTRVRGRTITGRAAYSIPAGRKGTVEIKLSARNRSLIRTARRVRTQVTITTNQANGRRTTVTRNHTLRVA